MTTYSFTLVTFTPYGDGGAVLEEASDALFEAGLDDGTVSGEGSSIAIVVDREAPDLLSAIVSAIRDVRRAGHDVEHVMSEGLVSLEEVAQRLGRSRQSLQHWASGKRGPGDFPAPAVEKGPRVRLWRWSVVASWLERGGHLSEAESRRVRLHEDIIWAVNGTLARQRLQRSSLSLLSLDALGAVA